MGMNPLSYRRMTTYRLFMRLDSCSRNGNQCLGSGSLRQPILFQA